MDNNLALLLVFLVLQFSGTDSSNASDVLLRNLLTDYQILSRPVPKETDAVTIKFGVTLMQIVDFYEQQGVLRSNIWETLEWTDVGLVWDPSDYDNITELMIPPHRIWKPDIYVYNSASEQFDDTYQTNAVVKHNGSVTFIPPGIHYTTCRTSYTNFPFDEHKCELKFGSWTSHGGRIDLQLQDSEAADVSSFVPNIDWELLSMSGRRNSIFYACCPDPYMDITYVIHLRRKGQTILAKAKHDNTFMCFTLVLSFLIPVTSGHKITFAILHVAYIYSVLYFIMTNHPLVIQNSADRGGPMIRYFEGMRGLSEFTLGVNVFLFWLYRQTGTLPYWLSKIILERLPKLGALLGINHKTTPADGIELVDDGHPSNAGASVRPHDYAFVALILDRIFFIIFTLVALILWLFAFPSYSDVTS